MSLRLGVYGHLSKAAICACLATGMCVGSVIANSLSVAKVAPTEMAGEAGPNKPALLNRQRM